jgi:signal transduction histidine kinase
MTPPDAFAPLERLVQAFFELLVRSGRVESASLWMRDTRHVRCAASAGGVPSAGERALARRVLAGEKLPSPGGRRRLHAVALGTRKNPVGAIVMRGRPEELPGVARLVRDGARILAGALAEAGRVQQETAGTRVLAEATERRLARVGLDLHDGPLQEAVALRGELALFRAQLGEALAGHQHRRVLAGRVDDALARVDVLASHLRDMARTTEPPTVEEGPFADAVRNEAAYLERESGIKVDARVNGDLDELTASQRIALMRVIQESLRNVREHSDARRVRVRVAAGRSRVEARITDDGRGFRPERALAAASRAGRLGLAGMAERIRLLGGEFTVKSQPGGPTEIRAAVPRVFSA